MSGLEVFGDNVSCPTSYMDSDLMDKIREYGSKPYPPIKETEEIVLDWLSDYAYNGMELCRIVNGYAPHFFIGCNRTAQEAGWNKPKGGCRGKERGCRICYNTFLHRLNKLHKDKKIRSLTLNSFDGRRPASTEIPTDKFRFWYIERSNLAIRLHQDLENTLGFVSF